MPDEKEIIPETIDTAGEVEDIATDLDDTNGSVGAPGQDSPGGVPDDASGSSGSEGQGQG